MGESPQHSTGQPVLGARPRRHFIKGRAFHHLVSYAERPRYDYEKRGFARMRTSSTRSLHVGTRRPLVASASRWSGRAPAQAINLNTLSKRFLESRSMDERHDDELPIRMRGDRDGGRRSSNAPAFSLRRIERPGDRRDPPSGSPSRPLPIPSFSGPYVIGTLTYRAFRGQPASSTGQELTPVEDCADLGEAASDREATPDHPAGGAGSRWRREPSRAAAIEPAGGGE